MTKSANRELVLDINDEISRAADEKARAVIIRRLKRALEKTQAAMPPPMREIRAAAARGDSMKGEERSSYSHFVIPAQAGIP